MKKYTGFKDKRENKIYDGDLLNIYYISIRKGIGFCGWMLGEKVYLRHDGIWSFLFNNNPGYRLELYKRN